MHKKIAIIGAGISGITAARELAGDASVCVFEKSRGLGGRMATRRAGGFSFDHAAQFFTARSNEFREQIEFAGDKAVRAWTPQVITIERGSRSYKREWFETHFVGTPGMNEILKMMTKNLSIRFSTRVSHLQAQSGVWRLYDDQRQSLGDFDWVISSAPVPQTLDVLPDCFSHRSLMREAEFSPCYALMLGFEQLPSLGFDAAVVKNEAIAWISANHSKPGRSEGKSLLIHSDNYWAAENLEADQEFIINRLTQCLGELTAIEADKAKHIALHRWLYARVEKNLATDYLLDSRNKLAACGDWCRGNRVEDAFLSGQQLAKELKKLL